MKEVKPVFLTLKCCQVFPPTRDMIVECKKIGRYKNKLMEQEYPKIEIVTVEDILNGNRITIPTSQQIAVIKSESLMQAMIALNSPSFNLPLI